jgi:hypothetical protein
MAWHLPAKLVVHNNKIQLPLLIPGNRSTYPGFSASDSTINDKIAKTGSNPFETGYLKSLKIWINASTKVLEFNIHVVQVVELSLNCFHTNPADVNQIKILSLFFVKLPKLPLDQIIQINTSSPSYHASGYWRRKVFEQDKVRFMSTNLTLFRLLDC